LEEEDDVAGSWAEDAEAEICVCAHRELVRVKACSTSVVVVVDQSQCLPMKQYQSSEPESAAMTPKTVYSATLGLAGSQRAIREQSVVQLTPIQL
jgi:hypothetical protein